MEQHEAQLKQRIQQRMHAASKATFDAGTVSWKRSKDSVGLDIAPLAARPIPSMRHQ